LFQGKDYPFYTFFKNISFDLKKKFYTTLVGFNGQNVMLIASLKHFNVFLQI